MALNEKEKTTIKDLQTQEQTCIKKYKKYGQDARSCVKGAVLYIREE